MIIRYDPFRELDRLSRQVWGPPGFTQWQTSLPLDVHRYNDHIEAAFDLPGVNPESIEVTVEKDTLNASSLKVNSKVTSWLSSVRIWKGSAKLYCPSNDFAPLLSGTYSANVVNDD